MPQRDLVYYFSLHSPWSYLGHAAFMDLVRRHDLRIDWRTIDLPALFPESGGLPLAQRHPSRRTYRDVELQRWRDRLGLPLRLRPRFWPVAVSLADRLVLAIAQQGQDPDPFVRTAFRALWADERDLADPSTLADLLASNGYEPGLLDSANSLAAETAYADRTEEALKAGVFGAPTYVIDGELFWGQDRLPLLDDMLATGRPAYRA